MGSKAATVYCLLSELFKHSAFSLIFVLVKLFSGYAPGFDTELFLSHYRVIDIIKSIHVSNSLGVSGIIHGDLKSLASPPWESDPTIAQGRWELRQYIDRCI